MRPEFHTLVAMSLPPTPPASVSHIPALSQAPLSQASLSLRVPATHCPPDMTPPELPWTSVPTPLCGAQCCHSLRPGTKPSSSRKTPLVVHPRMTIKPQFSTLGGTSETTLCVSGR